MKYLRNNPALKRRRQQLRCNQTDAEKLLWTKVRNKQFYGMKFFRQYSICPYILDFYCPAVKLAIELDGGQHNQPDNKQYDAFRSEYLKAHGIEMVRLWNHEVLMDVEGTLTKLMQKITPPDLPFAKGEE